MSDQVTDIEYAVEVPNRGYAGFAGTIGPGIEPTLLPELADAEKTLDWIKGRYEGMGCPEIARTCRIVQRTITVTRGEWEPA